jgi:hypothetical protein
LRKNENRPPGRSTLATSAIAPSTSSMCSNTRQATTASNERRERERSRSGGGHVHRSPAALVGDTDLVPGRIDADHRLPPSSQHPADLAVAAPDVEHAIESRQLGARQRQDLLDVLRIGALGEPVDPPVGVVLPQLVIRRFVGVGALVTGVEATVGP